MFGFGRLAVWLLHAPRVVVVGLVLLVALIVAGAGQLRLDVSARAFFGAADPAIAELDAHLLQWGEELPLVVLVTAPDGDLLDRDRLTAVHSLGEALAAISTVSGVTSFADHLVPGPRGLGGGRLPVPLYAQAPSVDRPGWSAEALGAPGLVPRLLSKDGRHGILLVDLAVDTDDLVALHPVITEVRALLASEAAPKGLELSLTGVPALNAGVLTAVARDQRTLVPMAGLGMAALLWTMFGSARGVWIPGLAAVLPLLLLLGVMGWVGEPIGALNQTFSVLIPVIAVADAIHLLSRYEEELRRAGRDEAVDRTFRAMGVACLFTSLTTFVGFLSLMAGRMPVLRQYGLYAAVGVALAFVVAVTFVPLALRWTSPAPQQAAGRLRGLDLGLQRIAGWAFERPRAVLVAASAAAALGGLGALQVRQDFVLSELLGDDSEVARAGAVVDRDLAGVLSVEVGIEAPAGTFDQPEAVALLASLDDRLAAAGVRAVWSPAALARSTLQVTRGRSELPKTVAGMQAVWQQAPARRVEDVLDATRGRARILVHLPDEGAQGFAGREEAVEAAVDEVLGGQGWAAVVTGTQRAAYRGFRGVGVDLRSSVGWAFLGVAVMVSVLFGSVRLGLLSLVPNLVPLVLALGLMGLVGWPLDQFTGVTLTIGLGLCVDDTIHLLARLREELASGQGTREAAVNAVRFAGSALTTTTFVLGVGFALQGLSVFPGNRILGLLGAFVLIVAWISNLLLVPALAGLGAFTNPRQAKG